MTNYKHRILLKLIIIWILVSVYPVTNQFNHLTAYRINKRVFTISDVVFYSTIAYLITLFIFGLINKINTTKFGRGLLLITGTIPIILPYITYKTGNGLGAGIYMILDGLAIASGVVVYFLKRTKSHLIEGLLIYLSQFLGLFLIIIIWQRVTNINFEIILFVGVGTLFLTNLILLEEIQESYD